jgi:hypothetical protein
MSEELRDAGTVQETRATGWSCPFCDAKNPRSGDELDLTIDVSQAEFRCDYCETIPVHLTCPPQTKWGSDGLITEHRSGEEQWRARAIQYSAPAWPSGGVRGQREPRS